MSTQQANQPELAADVTSASHPHSHRSGGRMVILALVLTAAISAVYFSHFVDHAKGWLTHPDLLRIKVQSLGLWIYPVCIISCAAMVACGVPRLLVAGLAGVLFGFWTGTLVSEIGTVLGYYCVFMFVRWGGQHYVLHRWPKLKKWADHLKGQGVVGVILLRQMPVHGTLTNLALGLSGMRPAAFVIGTAIGLIPEGIPAVLVGASLLQGSKKSIAMMLGGAVVAFAVLFVVARYFVRSRKNKSATAELLHDQLAMDDI